MPTVFRHDGFRFFFYSNEGDPREPVHILGMQAEGTAKLWTRPDVTVADSSGFDARTLRRLIGVVEENRDVIERAWHEYFG